MKAHLATLGLLLAVTSGAALSATGEPPHRIDIRFEAAQQAPTTRKSGPFLLTSSDSMRTQ
jgi:hypothetical protein